jgi:hypothetical protein
MKTSRILAAAVTAATVAGLCATATAATAATVPQVGVGVGGTGAGYVGGTWMTASIAQGGTQTWTFKVVNTGTATESVSLLASGAGGLYSGGPAKQPASNIHNTISPSSVSLAPGASAQVTDTVTIPASAPLGLIPGNAPGASASLAYNTVWAYVGATSGGQVSMAAAAGLRQYITVVK